MQVMKATDPATWQANLQAAKLQVSQLAAQMGAMVPSKNMSKIVEQTLTMGMDEDALRSVLGHYITFTKDGTLKGEAGMAAANIKQYAYDQGVALSDTAVKNYAALITSKMGTEQDYKSFIDQQAIDAFPGYADDIAAGVKVQDLAQPYIQQVAAAWEVPDTSIGISDPLIRNAMNGMNADNKPRGITQTDFAQMLRQDPRYRSTQQAQNQTMSVGLDVLKQFGVMS
jgi:hypothetical protein